MTRQIELEVVGLSTEASVQKATQAIADNRGVLDVRVYRERGRAFVDVARGTVIGHLLESLEAAGFMGRLATDEDD